MVINHCHQKMSNIPFPCFNHIQKVFFGFKSVTFLDTTYFFFKLTILLEDLLIPRPSK